MEIKRGKGRIGGKRHISFVIVLIIKEIKRYKSRVKRQRPLAPSSLMQLLPGSSADIKGKRDK